MGATIGGDAAESGKKTHLLVMFCMRLLQKIGLLNLRNGNQLKKETAGNNVQILCVIITCGICLMLHTPYYYYTQTNVNLLMPYVLGVAILKTISWFVK